MRQNRCGEWEVVPPGDPEYDRDRFGWHLDPLEIDELLTQEKMTGMADIVEVELKITAPDGEIRIATGVATATTVHDGSSPTTKIKWRAFNGKFINVDVTPAPFEEPTTPGTTIELSDGSKWIRTVYTKTPWVCYYSGSNPRESSPHGMNWYSLTYLNPKLVTD